MPPVRITRILTVTWDCSGFGFVTFEDHRDAADAVDKLRDFELRGRRFRMDFDAGVTKKQDAG
jgi:RNA recognition motif-containing protein